MAFEGLSDRLQNAMGSVTKKGKITEADLKQMMREVRLALLEADVNFKVVKDFVRKVNERALGSNVLEALSPAQQVVKIVNEELTELMGGEQAPFQFSPKPPTVVMMVGLQGAGKTTTAGKLASFLAKHENKRPLLVAADVYRPAAIDQLQTLGKQLNYPVFSLGTDVNPVEIARQAIERATIEGRDLVIIDTAGRLHIDEALMEELQNIKAVANPNEILLVVDAMTGQDAVNVAETFNERLDITGVILTKLDGDTRGGAALTIRSVVNKPIKFISTGEKMDALDLFYPERMADRILGMGDVVSLVERAQEQFDEEEAKKLNRKIQKNELGFDDFLKQLQMMKKMGGIKDLMGMLPGVGKVVKDVDINDDSFKHIEAMIQSMTPEERRKPSIITMSRRQRIAKGSGRKIEEVTALMKQFEQLGKTMKLLQSPQGKQLMAMMSKGGFPGMGGMPFGK